MAAADFLVDTSVEAVPDAPGTFRATLSPEWAVWGPFGGYLAAIALRAALAASRFSRPASMQCHFVGSCEFAPVELHVLSLGGGKRAESLRVDLRQQGRIMFTSTIWLAADDMLGLEHDVAKFPSVPGPGSVKGYQDLTSDYPNWFPLWRNIEGRPLKFREPPGEPVWQAWLRFTGTAVNDRIADALRQLLWLDLPGWNAIAAAHPQPPRFLGPNLDLTVQFHRFAPEEEWTFCDGIVSVAADGLAGSFNRLWTPGGRLLSTGTLQHMFRPNPNSPENAAKRALR